MVIAGFAGRLRGSRKDGGEFVGPELSQSASVSSPNNGALMLAYAHSETINMSGHFLSQPEELSALMCFEVRNEERIAEYEDVAYAEMASSISKVIKMESKYEEHVRSVLLLHVLIGDMHPSGKAKDVDLFDRFRAFGKFSIKYYVDFTLRLTL